VKTMGNLLFDASSLVSLLKLRNLKPLNQNHIQWLTVYEVANALWKETFLIGSISADEARKIIEVLRGIMDVVNVLGPHSHEREILETAGKLGITAYDASYIALAKVNGLSLVTEDAELRDKARRMIKVFSVSEIL